MTRRYCSVGINDADYNVRCRLRGKEWTCPYYTRWANMMKRGHSLSFKASRPTYKDVVVCKEWHSFMVFKSWMETQDWEGNQLDKDILTDENEYNPNTCVFIPQYMNTLFTDRRLHRGDYPLGVTWNKSSECYRMSCSDGAGKVTHINHFSDPHVAHISWIKHKIQAAYIVLSKYEKEKCFDHRVRRALLVKIEKLTHSMCLNLEVKKV